MPTRPTWEHSSFRRSWSLRSAALPEGFWSVAVGDDGLFEATMVNGLNAPPRAEFATLREAQTWCSQIDALMTEKRPVAACEAA